MKKTFLAKRNALLSSASARWGVLALSCVLALFFVRLLAPNFFLQIFAPLYRAADVLAAQSESFISGFKNTSELAVRNAQLMAENTALMNENKALLQKEKDTVALGDSGILAGVVAHPPLSPYDTFILAAGSNDGVALGMEAFGDGGVPLGVVSLVLADFSRVTLFSAPGITTSGWVGNKNTFVTLTGAGAGALQAVVPRAANIAVGDAVFVPGPGALPIGKVARIDGKPSAPSVTLRIAPALNIFGVTWVVLRDVGSALAGASLCATSTSQ